MNWRHIRTLAVYAVIIVTAGVIGLSAADFYSSRKAEQQVANRREERMQFLGEHLKEIAVGSEFPDVEIIASNQQASTSIHELLPNGGVVVFLSKDCGGCLTAADTLALLVKNQVTNERVIVVVNQDAALVDSHLSKHGLMLPLYTDTLGALANNYGVVVVPAFFRLNSAAVLEGYSTTLYTQEEIAAFLGN